MRQKIFGLLCLLFVLVGCSDSSDTIVDEEAVKKIIVESMDIYMNVVNNPDQCGDLATITSRRNAEIDFSSFEDFFISALVKISPDMVMAKVMEFDCEYMLGEGSEDSVLNFSDVSYSVEDFKVSNDIAKIYIHIDAYNKLLEKYVLIKRVYAFEKDGDEWLLFETKKY